MKLSHNFDSEEFACRCGCGFDEVDPKLIELLEIMRATMGRIIVNSGCRCKRWNESVDGSEASAHLLGQAADIRALGSKERYQAVASAVLSGCTRIGIGETFIHVDCSEDLPQSVIWTY